jgi:hypothetical protein
MSWLRSRQWRDVGRGVRVHGVDFDEFYEQLKQYIKEE